MCKFIATIIAIFSLLLSSSAYASYNDHCHVIHDNYASDVNLILQMLNNIKADVHAQQIQNTLASGISMIMSAPSPSSFVTVYEALNEDIATATLQPLELTELNAFLISIYKQMNSMQTRAGEWDSSQCSAKHNCELGSQTGYCSISYWS